MLSWLPGRRRTTAPAKTSEGSVEPGARLDLPRKFETRAPAPANVIDLFEGSWALSRETLTSLSEGGAPAPGEFRVSDFDVEDIRPKVAADALGIVPGSLDGMRILELGPLEGFHTWRLLKLGAAHVTAVEANAAAYLKCLAVKELWGLQNAEFLLGDCIGFLDAGSDQYDIIFCSGLLYHMEDPYDLIRAMAARSSRILVWTHFWYVDSDLKPRVIVDRGGLELTYFANAYLDTRSLPKFWGGNRDMSHWLPKSDILRIFESFGFATTVHREGVAHDIPWLLMTAKRERAGRAPGD